MKFVNAVFTQTLEVKQSKFIAYLLPYSEYKITLEKLKLSNLKARHFVVAYRYLNEFNQVIEYSSDDGEPKGTSGRPTLYVLQGNDIINSCIITVRYFGGTKLGTGGLARAYSDATNLVINSSTLLEYKEEKQIKIYFEYSNLRMIEYECEISGVNIINKEFDSGAIFTIKSSQDELAQFLNKVDRLIKIIE